MVFAEPDNLYFFALFALFVAAWISYGLWHRRVRRTTGDESLMAAMTASVDHRGRLLRRLLQLGGMALLILAIARPQWGMSDEEVTQEAIDIVFALDLSRSMLAEDVPPNRLNAAHQEVHQATTQLRSDRVGLVIFTSLSFVQAPLTSDYSAIDFFLQRLHPDQIPVGGTNLSEPIQDALDVLRGHQLDHETESSMHRSENQVIVLLTDGEDHVSSPLAAADQARQEGIRIVTVGIGSADGAPIPEFDQAGNRRGYVRDDNGERVITRADEELLREMAALTDGTFIRFEQPGQAANELVAFLDELERTALDEQLTQRHIDRFMWFLIPAFILLLASLFFGRRRTPGKGWRAWLSLAVMITALVASGCDDTLQRVDPDVADAAEAIATGEYQSALDHLDRLDDEHRDTPEARFNRGLAHMGLENHGEARQAFAGSLATQNPDLRADAHYHIGLAFSAEEQWAQARDSFQQGLQLYTSDRPAQDPDLQRALKQSLEVALRELFPPCSTFEDDFEPNPTPDEAAALEEFSISDLTLCGGSDDYFALPVVPGSTVSVEATFRELRDEPDPEHVFLPNVSDLELALYRADGQPLATDDPATTPEALEKQNERRRLQRRIEDFELDEAQLGPQFQGAIFVGLKAHEGLEFQYDLEIDHRPPCEAMEDEFEPNSTPDTAAPLATDETHQLQLCPGDEDWFALDGERGHALFVDIQPATDEYHDEPLELTVEMLRSDTGERVGLGQPDDGLLTAGLSDVDFDADLHLRVQGADDNERGPYTIDIHQTPPCEPSGSDNSLQVEGLSAQEQEHRYLRLCPDETNHYTVLHQDNQGPESVEWALRTLPDDAWRHTPDPGDDSHRFGDFPQMNLYLLERFNDAPHASAIGVDELDDGHPHRPDTDDQQLTDDRVLIVDEPPRQDQTLLQVDGEPGFFHLRRLDDEDQDDQDDQNQDDQDEQDQDDQDEQDQDDQDEQDQDDQDEQDQDDQDEQDQDEQDGQDQDDQDQDEQDGQDQDEQDGQDQEDEELTEEEELTADEIEAVLRSLEDADQNFQLQQRIEDTHRRDIEMDW